MASTLTPSLLNYTGGDTARSKITSKVYTSTDYPPEHHIPLHQEMSYSNNYPNTIYFFCHTPAAEGGETPILNARELTKDLDKKIIDAFREKKLKYIMNLHGGYGIGKSWQNCYETENKSEVEAILGAKAVNYSWKDDGGLRSEEVVQPVIEHPYTKEEIFFSQADQWHPSHLEPDILATLKEMASEDDFFHNCSYGDGTPIELEYLDEIRRVLRKHSISFSWQKGDLLILDNILAMHGRNPFKGARKILVAMS